jgi:hypothetical protein
VGKVYLPGTLIQDFTLVELAGDGTQSNVYLARRDGIHYWLLQLEDRTFDPQVTGARIERFEIETERWIALPTSGTSIVNLASWVDKLELAFIGWRWTLFARDLGLLHENGKVMQHSHPLSLERLVFNEQGELLFAQEKPGSIDEYVYPPPEGMTAMTPPGDVYSLGASFKALLGKTIPTPLQPVLYRATQADPLKRHKTAHAFAEDLADVLPDPNRVKQPKPPVPVRSYFRWGCLAGGAFLVLCCLLTVCGTIYTVTDPTFQRQFQLELERQLQEQQR